MANTKWTYNEYLEWLQKTKAGRRELERGKEEMLTQKQQKRGFGRMNPDEFRNIRAQQMDKLYRYYLGEKSCIYSSACSMSTVKKAFRKDERIMFERRPGYNSCDF